MGRELDYVIVNDKIGKGKSYIPVIDKIIDIRSAGNNYYYDIANGLEDILYDKMIDYGTSDELRSDIEYDWYISLDISKELEKLLSFNYPKYIHNFLIEVKENGNKIGFCLSTGRLYSLGSVVETEVDIIDCEYVDDEYENLCPNPKDFMKAVDKLNSNYGISIWTSIYFYEDFDSYKTSVHSKKRLTSSLLIKDRSKNLSCLLELCKDLNNDLWEADEYKSYFEYMLLHLRKGRSFVYSA